MIDFRDDEEKAYDHESYKHSLELSKIKISIYKELLRLLKGLDSKNLDPKLLLEISKVLAKIKN